jgi:hypothetical protein
VSIHHWGHQVKINVWEELATDEPVGIGKIWLK